MSRDLQSRQLRAAWQTWRTRPLMICAGCLLLLSLLLPIVASNANHEHSSRNWHQRISYGKWIDSSDQFGKYYASGEVDSSFRGLDFHRCTGAGSTHLELTNVQDNKGELSAIPFEDAGKLISQFPGIEWIHFTGQQLRKTDPNVLNSLPNLKAIHIGPGPLHARDVERLSQVRTLQHIGIDTTRFHKDIDLSLLKNLRQLKSIRLTNGLSGMEASEDEFEILSLKIVRELAQLPHLQELVVDSNWILTQAIPYGKKHLSDEEANHISRFAKAVMDAPSLRILYVGRQKSPAERAALRLLRAELPNISVRPAYFSTTALQGLRMGLGPFVFFYICVAIHLVNCSSRPETWLIPNNIQSNQTIAIRVVLVMIGLQTLFILLMVNLMSLAAMIPVLALCSLEVAVILGVAKFVCNVAPDVGQRSLLSKFRHAPLILMALLLVLLIQHAAGAETEWFLRGERPVLAIVVLGFALWNCRSTMRQLSAIQRIWSEAGLPASMSVMDSFEAQKTMAKRRGNTASVERINERWMGRLHRTTASVRDGSFSRRDRMRVWWLANVAVDARSLMLLTTLFFAMYIAMSAGTAIFTGKLSSKTEMVFAPAATLMFLIVIFVSGSFYGRWGMFSMEVLRPVSRREWAHTAMQSTLAGIGAGFFWGWSLTLIAKLLLGIETSFIWLSLSLVAYLVFAVLSTGLLSLLVVSRKTLSSALCVFGILMGAAITLGVISASQEPFSSQPEVWIWFLAAEAVIAACVITFAWKRLPQVELGIS